MEIINIPINKQEQYNKIIEDTEEIIKNFREISEIMVSKIEKTEDRMFKLGKNIVNEYPKTIEQTEILGNKQIKFII